ncbi:LLM class flavin-dependent oxidoreductase [Mycobacterium hubeiense]|uniref:LLM class flavin-dependent oxidoreductase n=1 Tax=Mycobacterium hubeiense TaxID=1867256 RepID=UPI000C7EB00B|nr:LLM class flavin-dependent oxidoreductase [Mycobacterium sp. QGD 101]
MAEWFLFLPQVRLEIAEIVERARVAEASGFDGIAFIDHLESPGAAHQSIWEAMTVADWVAARTEKLRIGHLVLCSAFRHPAVLAKQAVTLSAASGGRFDLGLGSGSWPAEFTRFDIEGADDVGSRVRRLERDLELIRQYWGDSDVAQQPRPPHRIPLVLGGTGKKTMALVRRYADWWNIPAPEIGKLAQLRPDAGAARVSIQQMVGFVGAGADRDSVIEVSNRRFGHLGDGLVCGDAAELGNHFAGLAAQGVERFYVWFADFAQPETLSEFADTVMREDAT